MKLRIAIALLGTILTSLLLFAQEASTPLPTQSGMYVQTSSGYTRLELNNNSGFKTAGAMKSAFTYGVAKVRGKWLYRNANALASIANHRPTFVLISQFEISTQAVALIRFEAKKDHREAQYCEVSLWSGAKVENKDKDVIPITVTRISNSNNLLIVPQEDILPGEYLLTTAPANGANGYDFSIK